MPIDAAIRCPLMESEVSVYQISALQHLLYYDAATLPAWERENIKPEYSTGHFFFLSFRLTGEILND
jgi:hypothetical protein